jgi:hypothetical protein
MTDQENNLDVQKYKDLLENADKEITRLREHVSSCSVTIFETILAQDEQTAEVNNLRERVAELEAILAQSDEHAEAAANVFAAMQAAMSHMQETIDKVSESAKQTAADTGIVEQMSELREVAGSTLDDEALAAYNRHRHVLKEKIRPN